MAAVVFNYTTWAARYPELSAYVDEPLATIYFSEATLYCDNGPCSPVVDEGVRSVFLNMLTAHIAALNAPLGAPSSPLVGRISNASEGSVSVATQNDYPAGSVQWFQQTKYGAAFWQASAQYRTMQYVVGPAYAGNPPLGYPRGR